jgi:hypothetical protein
MSVTRDSGTLPLLTDAVKFSPLVPQKVESGIAASNPANVDAKPVSYKDH